MADWCLDQLPGEENMATLLVTVAQLDQLILVDIGGRRGWTPTVNFSSDFDKVKRLLFRLAWALYKCWPNFCKAQATIENGVGEYIQTQKADWRKWERSEDDNDDGGDFVLRQISEIEPGDTNSGDALFEV